MFKRIAVKFVEFATKYVESSGDAGNPHAAYHKIARYYIPLMPTPYCTFDIEEYEKDVITRIKSKSATKLYDHRDFEAVNNNLGRMRELRKNDRTPYYFYSMRLNDKSLSSDIQTQLIAGTTVRGIIVAGLLYFYPIAGVFPLEYVSLFAYYAFKCANLCTNDEKNLTIVSLYHKTEDIVERNTDVALKDELKKAFKI